MKNLLTKTLAMGVAAAAILTSSAGYAAAPVVEYHTVKVDGLDVFYREAGPKNAPTILLLHGFPTSSHMFRDLIPLLADRYHVVAPDYPGFGYSSTPSVKEYEYTFDHLADVTEHFVQQKGLHHYVIYMQDYGGPVGFRLFSRHPDDVKGFIIQNANAYTEGLSDTFKTVVGGIWGPHDQASEDRVRGFFELDATKSQYMGGAEHPERVSPDSWQHAQWGMDRPGNKDVQYVLQENYKSNTVLYDGWHAAFRKYQPQVLVVWGKNDPFFTIEGAKKYGTDLKHSEYHFLNAGHFALEEKTGEIASYIHNWMDKKVK